MTHEQTLSSRIEFRGAVGRLNCMSKDDRVTADSGVPPRTRPLPLALLAHLPIQDDESRWENNGVGCVDRVYVEGPSPAPWLMAHGYFDNNPFAWKVTGALSLGLLNLQLDLDDAKVLQFAMSADDDTDFVTVITDWCVAAVTISKSPGAWDLPRAKVKFPLSYGEDPGRYHED